MIIFLSGIILSGCLNLIAGYPRLEIFRYPQEEFVFKRIGDYPPLSASRFDNIDLYSQEIDIALGETAIQAGKDTIDFESSMTIRLFLNRQFETIYFHELRYKTDTGNNGVFPIDFSYSYSHCLQQREHAERMGLHYWPGIILTSVLPADYNEIFPNMEIGDHFLLKLEFDYSFDDESVKTQMYEYAVFKRERQIYSEALINISYGGDKRKKGAKAKRENIHWNRQDKIGEPMEEPWMGEEYPMFQKEQEE
jgi:hypothetical protein